MILSGHGLASSVAVSPSMHSAARASRPLTRRRWGSRNWRNRVLFGSGIELEDARQLIQQTERLDPVLADRLGLRAPGRVGSQVVELAQQRRLLVPADARRQAGIGRRPAPVGLEDLPAECPELGELARLAQG